MQMIKSMEELFLCTFLTYNKLDIVDQKHIVVTVLLAESRHGKLIAVFTDFQGVDQFVGEGLTGYI